MGRIVESKEFHRNKHKLIQLERQNYDRIIVIERTGKKGEDRDWREIGDHSALLYYYQICEPLGEQVNFKNDVDSYYERYEIGLICMNGLTKMRMLIKKSGLYESEQSQGPFRVFKLKKTFTSEDMRRLMQKERKRRKEANEIIKVDFSDPELYICLREVAKKLHKICNEHFDHLSRDTIGRKIVTLADENLTDYRKLCTLSEKKTKEKIELWRKIYYGVRDLAHGVQTATGIEVMNSTDGASVSESLRKALRRINSDYNMTIKRS